MLSCHIALLYIIIYIFYVMVKCYHLLLLFLSFTVTVCDCLAAVKATYILTYNVFDLQFQGRSFKILIIMANITTAV